MNHRIERVRELLRRNLGDIIERDLRFEGVLVTISDVDITPDLKQAHVFVSLLGGDPETVLAALRKHRVELQHALARRVVLKNTPRLNFHHDASAERGTRILQILEEIPLPAEDGPSSEGEPDNEPEHPEHR
jgi:ribosome-binding factor A